MHDSLKGGTQMSRDNEIVKNGTAAVGDVNNVPMGFEDEDAGDMIVPRIKVIQSLSPERKDKIADEGDIINSLTKEKLNGKVFVPVFKFNSNIEWRDRSEGGGLLCMARDGKNGEKSDGTRLLCAACKRCEFDNSKQGKEAMPKCTKYINFFGFFAGECSPIILSFARTNYNEGRKLYSLAKVTMQNMWNYGYTLEEKQLSKNGNEWFIITATPQGPTSDADREFGMQLYSAYRNSMSTLAFDLSEETTDTATPQVDTNATEF